MHAVTFQAPGEVASRSAPSPSCIAADDAIVARRGERRSAARTCTSTTGA